MRYDYLDNIRILQHILRCAMHLSVPFMVLPSEVWPIRAVEGYSQVADGYVFFIHAQVMEIFFALNGFFAIKILLKYGNKTFIINRLHRIGVPFVLGILLLVPVILALGLSWQKQIPLQQIAPYVQEGLLHGKFTFAHLWSLWYLMIIYAIFLLIYNFKTLKINTLLEKTNPKNALLTLAFLASFSLVFYDRKYTLMPLGTYFEWQMILYFATFFFLGVWYFYWKEKLENTKPNRYLWLLFLIAIVVNLSFQMTKSDNFAFKIAGSVAYVVQSICCLIYCWYAMKKVRLNPILTKKLSDAMYWVYWIEVPMALLAHYYFVNSVPALVLVLGFTLLIIGFGYFSYHYFLKKTKLGKWLGFVG